MNAIDISVEVLDQPTDWPATLEVVRRGVLAFATALRDPARSDQAVAAVRAMLERELAAVLRHPDPRVREARGDAFNDITADREGLAHALERVRGWAERDFCGEGEGS